MVSEESTAPAAAAGVVAGAPRGRYATKWLRRTSVVLVAFWTAAVVVPEVLQLGAAWRAFGTGLIIPGAGLLYAIPAPDHPFGTAMVAGHVLVITVEILAAAFALRRSPVVAATSAVLFLGALALATSVAPGAVVIAGHVAGFLGVLIACVWAIVVRLIGRADSVTLVVLILASASVGAVLTSVHGGMLGPSMGGMLGPRTWLPWSVWAVAIGGLAVASGRAAIQRRGATERGVLRSGYGRVDTEGSSLRARTAAVALDGVGRGQMVTEATADQRGLMRYLLSVAAQPADDWRGFDPEGAGPLQQYRYQLNSLGWALATYQYSHAPAFVGSLTGAQVALFDRMQHKAVWGYWYWQNLLGNWDFVKRRADPIDVPKISCSRGT